MKERRKVLVVEDIEVIREALCSVLEADGFEVHGCHDGKSALAAALKREFQVIITDYRMPNMSGADVARYLRMRFPASVIIGMSSDDKKRDFLAAGADAFLLKPYVYDDLIKLMNEK